MACARERSWRSDSGSCISVEQHLAHLRESLIPLAERCGRMMREALAANVPSETVGRSRPVAISLSFDRTGLD
jgi:hypothetical protein